MNFIVKMIDWVVTEVVVKKLAHSKTFQRFAVKTDAMIKNHSETINNKSEELIQHVSKKGEEIVTKSAQKSLPIYGNVGRFFRILKEEIAKDFK